MKETILSKDQLREFIKEKHLVTVSDEQNMLKEMFTETLQEMLEAEMDTELGYPKHGSIPEGSNNRQSGHTKKKVRSQYGELEVAVPREREGDYEPVVVKKHQKDVTGIEEQVPALYVRRIAGTDSNVTNRIVPLIKEWQSRPLQRHVSCKDTKKLLANVKPVYTAPMEGAALGAPR